MKPLGASILFVNSKEQILLLLRDNIETIPFPNMWDLPGGHVEPGETPSECIVREMREELGLALSGHRLFRSAHFEDRIEYTFWKREEIDIRNTVLTEGQALRWFSKREIEEIPLAFDFNPTVADFYKDAPYGRNPRTK